MRSDHVGGFPVLIPVEEAERRVLGAVGPLPTVHVQLTEANGYHLAEDVTADHDVPAFDRSAVDGYAVRAEDVEHAHRGNPARLRVVEEIAAGAVPERRVEPGTASRIMTGAPIPAGADAVVKVELTEEDTDRHVRMCASAPPGEAIGTKGSDVREGELVLSKGSRIGPVELGLLATFGVARVPVHRRPRVAIVSTGSELVTVDQPLSPGKLRDSNSVMLAQLARTAGAEPMLFGIVPDRLEALADTIAEALRVSDVVVTSGGVSMGDYDYVGRAYERLGVRVIFWKTLMRPGKPILFGVRGGKSLFGLAGNPASSFANAQLFLLPAIRRMAGSLHPSARRFKAVLDDGIGARDSDRTAFLRGTARVADDGRLHVSIARKQSSGVLSSYLGANCLAEAPGRKSYRPGDVIDVRWLE